MNISAQHSVRQDMDLKSLRDKRVLVAGLARTGQACLDFLLRQGAVITAADIKPPEAFPGLVEKASRHDIRLELGRHRTDIFLEQDLIVVSPGVPLSIEPLEKAINKGIPVISEVELAWHFITKPIVGITGSNGKTTTCALIGEIIRQAGHRPFVGGNIGNPLINVAAADDEFDFIVAELSSFQLEAIYAFRPHVALFLNISEDHLDRYSSFKEYQDAKWRLFINQGPEDFAVLNARDSLIMERQGNIRSRKLLFGVEEINKNCACMQEEELFINLEEISFTLDTSRAVIKGRHNMENIMAASLAAAALKIDPAAIQAAVESFKGVVHRLEFVRKVKGVDFYNDSKATNVGAAEKSLQSFDRPVVLIAGGRDKGGSYDPLKDLISEKVRAVVLIGEATSILEREFRGLTDIRKAPDMPAAADLAFSLAKPGDVVLLAPACSSFDMFSDYEERGRAFKEAAARLKEE
jgi:UDP-N-acetylmuramoylalanine--D-glutamate ligase